MGLFSEKLFGAPSDQRPEFIHTKTEWFGARDVADFLRLETESWTRPWGSAELAAFLRQPTTGGRVLVASGGSDLRREIIGTVLYRVIPAVAGLPGCIELERLTVAPEWRWQGCGGELLATVAQLRTPARPRVRALVPEYHVPAQLFLRRWGFGCVAIVPRAYHAGTTTAYLLEASLEQTA